MNSGPLWFSPDGRLIAAAGPTGFKLVRVADGSTLMTLPGTPEAAGFDGGTLRYLSDGTVVSLDISDLITPARLPGPAPDEALFSPDGRLLVTHRDGSRSLALWDVAAHRPSGPPLRMPGGDPGDVRFAFSGDGRFLATVEGAVNNVVSVWDTAGHTEVIRTALPGDWIASSVALDADGTRLAIGGELPEGEAALTGRLLVWDVPHGRTSTSIDLDGDVNVVFRPHGTMVAPVGGRSRRLLDLSTGRETGPAVGPGGVDSHVLVLAFSPDGNTVAMSDMTGRFAFWDVRTGRRRGPTYTLNGDDAATRIAFSPRGDVAVTIGSTGITQFWDLGTLRKLGRPVHGGDADLLSAAFGSGGSVLRTLDASGTLRDMPVDPARLAATLCARTGRTLTAAEWRRHLPDVPYRRLCP